MESTKVAGSEALDSVEAVAALTVPWGGQQIDLRQISFAAGGAALLRVRIREGRRFTIFDIDAVTASAWGTAMAEWAARQPGYVPGRAIASDER